MYSAGDCLLIETNYDSEGKIIGHLHILVIDVVEPAGITIIVPCESYKSGKQDKTTILNCGDHDFITHKTYVNYGRAKIYALSDLQRLVDSRRAKKKETLKDEVLQRVRRGITSSKKTPPDVRELYQGDLFKKLD